jgi:creatinine amidohydrolase
MAQVRMTDPAGMRELIPDGNFGGLYQRPDDELLSLWHVAVEETRALLESGWGVAA